MHCFYLSGQLIPEIEMNLCMATTIIKLQRSLLADVNFEVVI